MKFKNVLSACLCGAFIFTTACSANYDGRTNRNAVTTRGRAITNNVNRTTDYYARPYNNLARNNYDGLIGNDLTGGSVNRQTAARNSVNRRSAAGSNVNDRNRYRSSNDVGAHKSRTINNNNAVSKRTPSYSGLDGNRSTTGGAHGRVNRANNPVNTTRSHTSHNVAPSHTTRAHAGTTAIASPAPAANKSAAVSKHEDGTKKSAAKATHTTTKKAKSTVKKSAQHTAAPKKAATTHSKTAAHSTATAQPKAAAHTAAATTAPPKAAAHAVASPSPAPAAGNVNRTASNVTGAVNNTGQANVTGAVHNTGHSGNVTGATGNIGTTAAHGNTMGTSNYRNTTGNMNYGTGTANYSGNMGYYGADNMNYGTTGTNYRTGRTPLINPTASGLSRNVHSSTDNAIYRSTVAGRSHRTPSASDRVVYVGDRTHADDLLADELSREDFYSSRRTGRLGDRTSGSRVSGSRRAERTTGTSVNRTTGTSRSRNINAATNVDHPKGVEAMKARNRSTGTTTTTNPTTSPSRSRTSAPRTTTSPSRTSGNKTAISM